MRRRRNSDRILMRSGRSSTPLISGRQAEGVLLKQLYSSIRPLLTPQQQTKLDTFEAMRIEGPPSNSVGVGVMFGKDFGDAVQ
jgi:hypothetical protein